MSLLSPFFHAPPTFETNIGKMLVSKVATLDDAGVVAWANDMDWSEPVLCVRRYGQSSLGGWPEAELSARSLAEVLVMTGDERLVKLLLTKEHFPQSIRFSGVQIKDTEYHSLDMAMSLANAAIRTGKPHILARVLDVALDDRAMPQHWIDGSRYSPAVCLASQRHLAPDTIMQMYTLLEDGLCRRVEEQWGKPLGKNFRKQIRTEMFSHACRVGSASVADRLLAEFKLPCCFSHWDDLRDMGEIRWCTDWVSSRQKWMPSKEDRRAMRDAEKRHPAELLLQSAIGQKAKLKETFSGEELARHMDTAQENFDYVLASIRSQLDGGSLLAMPKAELSEHLAPALVLHDAAMAERWLCAMGAPLSLQEAISWMGARKGLEAMKRRAGCGLVECDPAKASTFVEFFLAKHEDWNPAAVAWIANGWAMGELIEHWPVSEQEKAQVRSLVIAGDTPSVAARRPVRRV